MCGIIGINSFTNVIDKTMSGLKNLEYRGYDSAGISYIDNSDIITLRTLGKIDQLYQKIRREDPKSLISIAHTRWATHGEPSERNAHPHSSGRVSIVHNGIIENNDELRNELTSQGVSFSSETDSEIVLHLIEKSLEAGKTPIQAVRDAAARIYGSYALLILFAEHPDILIATKKSSPLVLGLNKQGGFVSSDLFSISSFLTEVSYLEDNDLAVIHKDKIEILDKDNKQVTRQLHQVCQKTASYEKGFFDHFMQKEIFEQPMTSKNTLDHYISNKEFTEAIPNLQIHKVEKIYIIACGTSYFAGLAAKHWFQNFLNISTDVEIASEFQYNPLIQNSKNLVIFISQSGETADTIRVLRDFKNHTLKSIGIVNVPESTIGREVDICLPIKAGQEIGVASTKAFTSQLVTLACLTLKAALEKNTLSKERTSSYIDQLLLLPGRISELLNHDDDYKNISSSLVNAKSVLYIGRGISYANACEGALKLKEISYIHSEAIPAGELKHGSIALVDEQIFVVALAPNDTTIHKTISNIYSVIARKGKVVLLSDFKESGLSEKCAFHLSINHSDIFSSPILYNIPLQLISYHTALLAGNNVDQPRNLAKSVTVE